MFVTKLVTKELMYEILRNPQKSIIHLADDMRGVKARLTSMNSRVGLVHTDMAHLSDQRDKLENRMQRGENRLNLNDPTH